MKNKTLRGTATLPLTIASALCMLVAPACSHKEKAPEQYAETVDVALPETDSVVIHREYPAYLTADKEIDIVARVNGVLTSVNYSGGDFVKKGTLLFTLEDATYRDAVSQAEAALATARSTQEYAKARYEAMKKALKSDAVSQMEVIQAKSDLEQAEASIANNAAALSNARTTLSYCRIYAPQDGHMSSNIPSVGAYINGASSPAVLAKLYDDSVITVNFNLEDDVYQQMVANMESPDPIDYSAIPINFSDALPHHYTANLMYIAPSIDRSTGTMLVQAHIRNEYDELKSGMYCKLLLPVAIAPRAILIKDAAIASDQLGKYIYTVNDSNRVVYTPIETGETIADTLRIVTKGLAPGQKYVTKAMLKVRDGMTVNPVLTK